MFRMRRRTFLVSRFVNMLLVVRIFFTHLLPLWQYLAFIATIVILQHFKEGYNPITLPLTILLFVQIAAQVTDSVSIQYIVSILGGILHFIPLKMYWLPEAQKLVGFRQDSLQQGLHYYQFYPLDQTQPITPKTIKWHIGKQIAKMLEYAHINNKLIQKVARHLTMSYIDHHYIKVGEGTQLPTDSTIAFCHGRGGTPFTYTTYLVHLAGLGYRVGASQHSQVSDTGLKDMDEIKKYREREVQMRAAQFYQTILKVKGNRIILMGHSYGCSTALQAYHSLQSELKDRISHIVLLDPWFFPLTQAKFNQSIKCPVLILANQDFVKIPDAYKRNIQFMNTHNVEYLTWKNAYHLHQTDMGFINGNLLGKVKNSHLSQIMLDLNLKAIQAFLRGEKVEGLFGQADVGRNYVPEKFYRQDQFIY